MMKTSGIPDASWNEWKRKRRRTMIGYIIIFRQKSQLFKPTEPLSLSVVITVSVRLECQSRNKLLNLHYDLSTKTK